MAFSVWDVPLQLDRFGALSAAGTIVHPLPGHEEKVAAVSSLSTADISERH